MLGRLIGCPACNRDAPRQLRRGTAPTRRGQATIDKPELLRL